MSDRTVHLNVPLRHVLPTRCPRGLYSVTSHLGQASTSFKDTRFDPFLSCLVICDTMSVPYMAANILHCFMHVISPNDWPEASFCVSA